MEGKEKNIISSLQMKIEIPTLSKRLRRKPVLPARAATPLGDATRAPLSVEGWAAVAAVAFILLIVLATLPVIPW
jgi:hypothetical protein